MGFRRPRAPVIPGEVCPAFRGPGRSDAKVRHVVTDEHGATGIRDCGRCGAKDVPVSSSGGRSGGPTTAWYYARHIAPASSNTREENDHA